MVSSKRTNKATVSRRADLPSSALAMGERAGASRAPILPPAPRHRAGFDTEHVGRSGFFPRAPRLPSFDEPAYELATELHDEAA